MTDHCGSRITSFVNHQLILDFSGDDECEVTIATTSQFPMLMLYFETPVSCDSGYVSITNQDGMSESPCGDFSSSNVYTKDGDVKIKKVNIYVNQNIFNSFTVVITQFSFSDKCPSWGHACDHGRCIDAKVYCNGYDSCGDNSGCWVSPTNPTNPMVLDWNVRTASDKDVGDESKDNSSVFVGPGIGVVVFIIVIFIVTRVIYRRIQVGPPSRQTRPTAQSRLTAPPMQDESPNLEQINQGFSNELYVIQVQQTRENVPYRTPLYDQLPPPYDPAWAPNR